MKNSRLAAISILLTLTSLPAARAADAPSATESKNEIVVFGGISLLDASRSGQDQVFPLDRATSVGSRFGFGRNPFPLPIPLPPVSFSTESAIGSSALFGARYTRQIKDRLGLEADLTIAPGHEIETRGSGCIGDLCFGEGGSRDFEGRGRVFGRGVPFGGRNVNAWHYGAGLAYELTRGDVRPVLILGAGGVTWGGAREAGTDFVFRFGAGLKILFGRVGARVDVVDHLVLDQFLTKGTEHDVHATAGLLVRF
ncbi:MAG: hypothetical protein ACHP85_11120 [Burkholderiales bacterium]|jgi:hypothetical protein